MSINLCSVADLRLYLNAMAAGVKNTLVTAPGSGYTSITVTAHSVDGNGSGATFTGVLAAGALVSITITAPGSGYTLDPALVITGDGVGAAGTAYIGDDLKLAGLITRASAMFLNQTNRPGGILPQTVSERRNGNSAARICTYGWPILSVASVSVNGVSIAASNGQSAGWINDQRNIYLTGGVTLGLGGYGTFQGGYQTILLGYTFGWAAVPDDIGQAVIELVGQKYRRAQHIDQSSQRTDDGQVTSFLKNSVPEEVQDVIDQYRIKAIIE